MKRGVVLVFLLVLLLSCSMVLALPSTGPATPGGVDGGVTDVVSSGENDTVQNEITPEMLATFQELSSPSGNEAQFTNNLNTNAGLFDYTALLGKVKLFIILGVAFVGLMILQFIGFIIFLFYFFHLLKQSHKPEVTPELKQYVSACQIAGTSKKQLEDVLKAQGYDDATIALALHNYVAGPQT